MILIFTTTKHQKELDVSIQYSSTSLYQNIENILHKEFKFYYKINDVYKYGAPFNLKWNSVLDQLNLLNIKTIDDEIIYFSVPIIGTAVSSNNFREINQLLHSLSIFFKSKKIVYVYDLGLRYVTSLAYICVCLFCNEIREFSDRQNVYG